MGYGTWSSDAFDNLKSSRKTKKTDEIFTSTAMKDEMNPHGLLFRESRDSIDHPESVPVMVFLDVTGSMGRIPEILVREKLGALMDTIIKHGVPDPQILFGAIGDHICDQYPLQVGQFESATKELDQWLTKIYLEGGGGGQVMESYLLSWLVAARHTSIDCFEKRGSKGFLFTIGDEWTWEELNASALKKIMGYKQTEAISAQAILQEAQRMYEIFHIHINEASYRNEPRVLGPWKDLLKERLIILEDHAAIAETIATTVAVLAGADKKRVLASFDKSIAKTVSTALTNITGATSLSKKDSGVMKL
jgi:hypothetical protein